MDTTSKSMLPDFLIIPSTIILDKDLQPLDGCVYGVIYWYTKLKLEKCTASNRQLANILGVSMSGIANAIFRLRKKNFISVILNEGNHRLEIIPLVVYNNPSFSEEGPYSNEEGPLLKKVRPPYSNEEQNNNINTSNIKKYKYTVSKLTGQSHSKNTDIDKILSHLRQSLDLPKLDLSIKVNRQYAWNLIRKSKTGADGVLWLIDLAADDPWFRNHITSMRDLWSNQVKIVASKRAKREEVAYVDATNI